MFNNKDLGLQMLENPLNIQLDVIESLQNRLGGDLVLADPNNVFNFLLEAASEMTANSILKSEKKFEALYAKRARSSEDLYRHMSDFDYVGLFGSPSSTDLQLILDKRYLYDKAISYNKNYKKVVIPKDTIFKIGKYSFGIYYPIEIRLNNHVDSIVTVYDTSEENPFFKLNSNSVKSYSYTTSSLEFLSLQFPIYQFNTQIIEEPIISQTGFSKKYNYSNRFYSCRAFHYKNGEWKELNQTISEMVYDPNIPTIRISLEEEDNKIRFNIPSVYFSRKLMGDKLIIKMYTTHGELDNEIGNITTNNISLDFNFGSKDTGEYSSILKNIPTIIAVPLNNKVSGGSNGYTYEQLRSKVTNDDFYTDVLVRTPQLESCLSDQGFKIDKHLDNITDRIYFCYKTLTDNKGSIVQTTNTTLSVYDSLVNNVRSMIKNYDGTITILPTTLYEYIDSLRSCKPVENTDLDILINKTKSELVEIFNSTNYTKSPFHVHLINNEKYPRAISYNLMSPYAEDIFFEKENIDIVSQMILHTAIIQHLDDGTGGYRVRLGVTKSSDLTNVPIEDQVVYVMTRDINGLYTGTRATYIGDLNSQNVFEFYLKTDYNFKNDSLNITSLRNNQNQTDNFINLESKFHVVFMLNKAYTSNTTNTYDLSVGVPTDLLSDNIVMSRQNMTIHLGHSLENVIFNKTDSRWSREEYVTHEVDIYHTYSQDVYKRDDSGNLVYTIENGSLVLDIEHLEGDPILDDMGNPRIKNAIGDIKYGIDGKPIIQDNRYLICDIDMIQIDARQFISEHPAQYTYRNEMITYFESYFKAILATSPQLLEQTRLYFRPVRTLGNAQFGLGDGVILRRKLQLTFKMKCFVPDYVYKDLAIQNTINESIITIIEKHIVNNNISMVDLSTEIKSQLSDYINHINVLGIDDDVELQTLLVMDNDAQPSLAQELYLTKENTLALRKKIDIEYILS